MNIPIRSRPPSAQGLKRSLSKPILNTSKPIIDRPRLASTTSSSSITLTSNGKGKETAVEGNNIEVVVRIRKISSSEINSIRVAQSEPTRGNSVILIDPSTISTSSSSLNPSPSTPNEKLYNFGGEKVGLNGEASGGNVFGTESTQGMLFDDIVKPFLKQVLLGFNCTLFAYGQTGTGKTYTMEGDLSSIGGTFHSEAGIIPRSLYSIFQSLEQEGNEFSVKVSYIELYNEELRDLNALDGIENGIASGSQTSDKNGLKIYDDKNGVNITGLNETFIKSAAEGLLVLTKGSQRRQIAATKCNEQSSRSHSIFTITLQMKEISAKTGEEIIKIGKLNLVDLAGSENIGKSGAKESRAKEAGMINISLLALGRVINLLVQKATHIPYRESKLTRLLQDSLGGKTKTCIIATISPNNFDETISTLDYAFRAKSIQNKPEINSKMIKTALLKEYTFEIESLKSDLVATREKNGIYFSAESWNKMSLETASTTSSFNSMRIELEILNSKFSTQTQQFQQNLHLLNSNQLRLEKITAENDQYSVRELEMQKKIEELELKGLEDGKRINESQGRESLAREGERIAKEDVEGLLLKLERKTIVEKSNSTVIGNATIDFTSRLLVLEDIQQGLRVEQSEFLEKVGNELNDFGNSELEQIQHQEMIIKDRLEQLLNLSKKLSDSLVGIDSQSIEFQTLIEETQLGIMTLIRNTAFESSKSLEKRIEEVKIGLKELDSIMRKSVQDLAQPIRVLARECGELLNLERNSLEESQRLEREDYLERTEELEIQIETLTKALQAQTQQSALANDKLLTLFTNSISSQNSQNATAQAEILSNLSNSFVSTKEKNCRQIKNRILIGEERKKRNSLIQQALLESKVNLEETSRAHTHNFKSTLVKVIDDFDSVSNDVEETSNEFLEVLSVGEKDIEEGKLYYKENHSDFITKMGENVVELVDSVSNTYHSTQLGLEAARTSISTYLTSLSNVVSDHRVLLQDRNTSIQLNQKDLRNSIAIELQERVQQDLSTGSTPKRRVLVMEARDKEGGLKKILRKKIVLGERNL